METGFISRIYLRKTISVSEYQQPVTILDDLIDVVGEDENHPLSSLMEVVGVLIEKYEDKHVPELTEA